MADYTEGIAIRALLDAVLSDVRVTSDLRTVLGEAGNIVELNENRVQVAPDASIHIVARSAHTYEVSMGYGDHFRVLAAIGGVAVVTHGVPHPRFCFATLRYTMEGDLINVDFSKEMP